VTATGKVVQLAMGSGRNGGGVIKLSEDGQKLLEAICARKGWSEAEALEQALNFTAQALHGAAPQPSR
jgi:hypothetical protein